MKKTFLFFIGIFLSIASFSQLNTPNVVASGGNFFVGGNFTNSFTIGEMAMVETYSTGGFLLTQGFQQPYDFPLAVVPVENLQGFSAFPNPSNGLVSFQYNLGIAGHINVNVYDALGQLVYNDSQEKLAGPQQDQLDLSKFANGLYTVRYTLETVQGVSDVFVSRITLTK